MSSSWTFEILWIQPPLQKGPVQNAILQEGFNQPILRHCQCVWGKILIEKCFAMNMKYSNDFDKKVHLIKRGEISGLFA